MADMEFIEGLKSLIGKVALFKVKRLKDENDDINSPKHGFYIYDITGVVEKVELFTESKLAEKPMCVFVRNRNEYVALNVDRITEVDDAPPVAAQPNPTFKGITRPGA